MVDLTSLYTALPESVPGYGDFAKGQVMQMEVAKNQLELQKLKDEYEAQKGLRALFAQNPNASFGDISKYSPQLAAELMKAQQEGEQRSAQTQKTKREISQMEAQTVANTIGPIAEEAMATGDIQKYKRDIGAALSDLQQQGIPLPANFNEQTHTPDVILRNSVARGYKSPLMENMFAQQKEEMMNRVAPRQTPQQAYGSVEMGPYGPRRVPGLGGQMPRQMPAQAPQQELQRFGPTMNVSPEDLQLMEQQYQTEQDPNLKFQLGKKINELKMQAQGQPQSQFVTPEEEMALRVQEKQAEKKAQLEAEDVAAAEKQLSTLKALDTKNVESLIDKSIKSKPEEMLKGEYGLSGMAGVPTEANTATEELTVIEAQMRDMAKAIVGAGPISEGEQKIISKALGGIASAKDVESRKAAYHSFIDLAKEKMKKYPHLAKQMNAIEVAPSEKPPQATPSSLKIGDVKDGYEFLGGDPSKQSNWAKVK